MVDFTKIRESLINCGFEVSLFADAKSATEYLSTVIDGVTVGIGGSMSVKEMGLYEALCANNTVYWHWMSESPNEALKGAKEAQIYISSVNAISENGEIVNIDGTCNRVSSISYGHEKVYLIVGENKICEDLEKAIYRARNVAAPLNAKRLGCLTPCAVNADKCYDCDSKDRICKELSVLMKRPTKQNIEVLLIAEKLGY